MIPTPITPYHLKFLLSVNMLGDPSSSSEYRDMRMRRISKAWPTSPTTRHAMAAKPKVQSNAVVSC